MKTINKAESRDKKRNKKNKMIITGRSVFTILDVLIKKGKKKDKK